MVQVLSEARRKSKPTLVSARAKQGLTPAVAAEAAQGSTPQHVRGSRPQGWEMTAEEALRVNYVDCEI